MRRRDALVIGCTMAAALSIPPILRRVPKDFEFEPLEGFDGFRRLTSGAVSGGIDPFFGLDQTRPDINLLAEIMNKPLCLSLFGPDGWSSEHVPVAIFSDFNCPYCKVLEASLFNLRAGGVAIRLVWHEMPLLGPSSMRYAQAAAAAQFQGKGEEARAFLSAQTLRPGPAALQSLAQKLGLPAKAFLEEVNGTRVQRAIATDLHLGQQLGIPGTPGMMVGRTLVIGAINETDLVRLIELEATEPRTVCL